MAFENIQDFKGLHKNKNCFIISSGTSIKDLDLSALTRRITIGLNRSFMAFPETQYSCVMDHRLFDLYPEEIKQSRYLFTLEDRPWGIPLKLIGANGFSEDLEQGIYSGYTISYFALQVAIYMGFERIFFLGLDLKNTEKDTHFFGHDHRSANHENTEFPKMRKAFEDIAPLLKARGQQVYNCSPISSLKCFPFLSYEDALKY
ncbi:MAG: hypothetical protein ACJAS4_003663 [Bacteriovoracaceae bacterium]|jgi:hypothetical protein